MQRENKIKMTALEIYSCKIKLRHKNMVGLYAVEVVDAMSLPPETTL